MKKEQIQQLLEKYYKAETNLTEEKELHDQLQSSAFFTEEKDLFSFYNKEAYIPQNLENNVFKQIEKKEERKKHRLRIIQYASAAAIVLLLSSIFVLRPEKKSGLKLSQNEQFSVLEQALSQVSYSLQPSDDDDLTVVFQDENFEIVMN